MGVLRARFGRRAAGRLVAAGSPLVIVAASLGCGGDAADQASMAVVVETVQVEIADVPSTVAAIGTVEADHRTTIAAESGGTVSAILRDEGSRVGAGAAVVQLDPRPYQYAVQSAQANLDRAAAQLAVDERLLERYQTLLTAGAVDRQTFEDLQARVQSGRAAVGQARAAVRTAQWNLGKATVRAPFAGAIGRRHVQLGQNVSEGDPVFDLVDADPLRVRFRLPETVVGTVETGDVVRFRLRSDTVAARIATVDYVSPDIDPQSRTFEVTARYTDDRGGAVPGAYADVLVTTALHEDAALVPESAIVTEGEQNYVYVVAAGSKAEKREVALGSRVDGKVEVVSGLRAGETVLVAGQHGLPTGSPIRVAGADTTRADTTAADTTSAERR